MKNYTTRLTRFSICIFVFNFYTSIFQGLNAQEPAQLPNFAALKFETQIPVSQEGKRAGLSVRNRSGFVTIHEEAILYYSKTFQGEPNRSTATLLTSIPKAHVFFAETDSQRLLDAGFSSDVSAVLAMSPADRGIRYVVITQKSFYKIEATNGVDLKAKCLKCKQFVPFSTFLAGCTDCQSCMNRTSQKEKPFSRADIQTGQVPRQRYKKN